jgi:UDP-glucose 4-epimerase
MPRRTVVFGGAGFVGCNLAAALAERGDEVVLFDRTPPPAAARPNAEILTADVRDRSQVAAAIRRGTDCVVWGAAITADAARDASDPEGVLETNLAALVPVLRCAREAGVRRVLNLGSAAAYGEAAFRQAPLAEDDPAPDPRSLYALTKFAGERLCARLAELWGLDVVSVRLSAVFGPWERRTGARDTPSLFLQLMALAERGETARLARPSVRDWLYAPDMARAALALLDAPRLEHRLYNVGPGAAYSVLDWGQRLAARRPGFACRLAQPGETPNVDPQGARDRAPLAVARLAAETGFAARFGLEASVAHLDEWARAHPGWFGEAG